MSFDLTQLVLRNQVGRGKRASEQTRKLVAAVLADVASDDGGGIYLSVATIAARAACARRSVEYVLAEFEGEGLIRRDGKRSFGKGGAVIVWRIVVDRLAALPPAVTAFTVTRNGERNGIEALRATPVTDNASPHVVRTNPARGAQNPRTTCGQRYPEYILEDIQGRSVTRNGVTAR